MKIKRTEPINTFLKRLEEIFSTFFLRGQPFFSAVTNAYKNGNYLFRMAKYGAPLPAIFRLIKVERYLFKTILNLKDTVFRAWIRLQYN